MLGVREVDGVVAATLLHHPRGTTGHLQCLSIRQNPLQNQEFFFLVVPEVEDRWYN